MMTRLFVRPLAALLLTASFLAAPPLAAHNVDPLEAAPRAPAVAAQTETLAGHVRELLVEDRIAGVTVRYRSLVLADGTRVALRGDGLDRLAKDSRVEVTGRRNGKTLFMTASRELERAQKVARAGARAQVQGELRMFHIDYLDGAQSTFEFEVKVAGDEDGTPLELAVPPETLQRGMQVAVSGERLANGSIAPESIAILSLPDEKTPVGKVTLKATTTDKVLVILMRFTDSPAQPFSQAQVQAVVSGGPGTNSVSEYFKEVSYGQQLISATVTPWLATGAATPAACDWRAMGTIGRNAATAAGYVLSSYQKIVYTFPKVPSCGWLGLGYVGGSGVWVNGGNSTMVYGHELGHNFGLLHAGNLDCGANPIGGSCSSTEYADPFGIMGNQGTMHINASQKLDLGWIAAGTVKTHTTGSATYTLNPIETAGGGTYAVKIRAAANRTYWLEYRQPIGFDAPLASYPNNGAQVRLASPHETLCSGCDSYSIDTQVLDMTPATATFTDGALLAGRSFTDTTYGITFNVLSSTPSALTVQVVTAGGAVSTTTLASALNPSTLGVSVGFTATVTANAPTGTVTFKSDGATIAGCAAVALAGSGNTRTAACPTAALTTGAHSIVASYNGDGSNPASTSAALTQTVNAVPAGSGTNVALASAGAVATASTTYSANYAASSLINNERAGVGYGSVGGGWRDGTVNGFPDWVQVTFNGSKKIDRVVVYSVQNGYTSPVQPTDTLTGSMYLIRDFTVQGWNGSSWTTLATVSGNTLIKRTVSFAQTTTDRIRINITATPDGVSRLTEIEAWGVPATSTSTSSVVSSSLNPSTFGGSVTLTATVTGTAPTGTVAFTDGGVPVSGCSSVALAGAGNSRTAACVVSTLAVGSHNLLAAYGGDAANSASSSPIFVQSVTAAASANVALASAGATATSSSAYNANYAASALINNERAGAGFGSAGGGWRDATAGAFPDWVQINFSGNKQIDRVVVYSVQDSWTAPIQPTDTLTGSAYLLKSFTVQAWNGSAWVTLATVTGNTLIKRTVSFAQTTTDRIRINVNSTPDGVSRLTEVEAWGL